jgi:hypothetical protein
MIIVMTIITQVCSFQDRLQLSNAELEKSKVLIRRLKDETESAIANATDQVCDRIHHGTIRHGTARHGTARHGTARHRVVTPGSDTGW